MDPVTQPAPLTLFHKWGRLARTRGFTLIELLIVLIVIGIVASVISVNLAPNPRQALETETQRLSLLLQQAHDEAMASGSSIAFSAEQRSFRFWQARKKDETGDAWQAHADQSLFKPRDLATPITFEEIRINQQRAETRSQKIIFTPSGMTLPFRLTLVDGIHRISISGNALGQITLDKALPDS